MTMDFGVITQINLYFKKHVWEFTY